jgi:SPP1 gp7 family putative phage head morphogenesis protein
VDFNKISYNNPDFDMLAALKQNSYTFASNKGASFSEDLYSLLVNKNTSKIRPYSEYKKLALKLNETYNRHHLKTEYDHAVASSRMASKWNRYTSKGKDPILKYKTVNDSLVRQDHRKLNGIKKKASDPFFEQYYPPNGWRCRCDVVRLLGDEKETKNLPADLPELDDIFKVNTAKTGVIFPGKHPYLTRKRSKSRKQAVDKVAEKLTDQNLDFYPARSIKEAERFALEKGLAKEVKYTGLDLEAVNETNKTLLILKRKYGGLNYDGIKVVGIRGKSAYTTAARNVLTYNTRTRETISQVLEINKNYFGRYGSLAKIDEHIESVEKRGWWVAKGYKDIVAHEFGHFLTKEQTLGKSAYFLKEARFKDAKKLSIYGTSNLDESLAEIFALYIREDGKIDQELKDFLNKYSKVKIE